MSSNTVTVEKSYFETLLRKAHFHSSENGSSLPASPFTVTILKSEHERLLRETREYASLRSNLFNGGIDENTLSILIRGDAANAEDSATIVSATEAPTTHAPPRSQFSQPAPRPTHNTSHNYDYSNYVAEKFYPQHQVISVTASESDDYHHHSHSASREEPADTSETPEEYFEELENHEPQYRYQLPQYEKHAQRSVSITGLSEGTTHADVTAAVKGGLLLDIHLRPHEKAATVSFLYASSAQDFLQHSRRHDLYVKSKRVNVRWADRQFILPGHVSNKIANNGASRNLIIFNRTAKHTAESIREDLDHIHNLTVVGITFEGNNAHISTNSVHNAMFARTCMMSRSTYKASKVEWDFDECDVPLEEPVKVYNSNNQVKKKEAAITNRFHLLNVDTDGDDSELDDSILSGASIPSIAPITAAGVVV